MKKAAKTKIKRASLDLKRLQFLADNELVEIIGGYVSGEPGDGTPPPPKGHVGGNSYWN